MFAQEGDVEDPVEGVDTFEADIYQQLDEDEEYIKQLDAEDDTGDEGEGDDSEDDDDQPEEVVAEDFAQDAADEDPSGEGDNTGDAGADYYEGQADEHAGYGDDGDEIARAHVGEPEHSENETED